MKLFNIIKYILLSLFCTICFVGCSSDKDELTVVSEDSNFELAQDSIIVKIGSENATVINVKEGEGEYNAFSLDNDIAKAEVKDGKVYVEGFKNGTTYVVVSDKKSRYRRVQVSVYTTDKIGVSDDSMEVVAVLGKSVSRTMNITLGNGGYTIKSDNPSVKASITEEGLITVTATSKLEEYSATVTIKDYMNYSVQIHVNVKATTEPFTNEELEAIMASNKKEYSINDFNGRYYLYSKTENSTLDDGKIRYGWKYYYFEYMYIDFVGDRTVGIKSNALLTYYCRNAASYGLTVYTNQQIELKIIKNDGTNIWGVFSSIDRVNEKLVYGYFCDTIE